MTPRVGDVYKVSDHIVVFVEYRGKILPCYIFGKEPRATSGMVYDVPLSKYKDSVFLFNMCDLLKGVVDG